MTDDDRKDWLIAARASLNGIPADLLARGCAVARKYCDHPSKVVPTIVREIETAWTSRQQSAGPRLVEPEPEPQRRYATPDQVAAIKAEFRLDELGSEREARKLAPLPIPRANRAPVALADDEIPRIEGMSVGEIFEQRDRIRAERMDAEMSSMTHNPVLNRDWED